MSASLDAPAAAGSPSERYRAGVAAAHWQDDSAQREVLGHFDRLWRELNDVRPASVWRRLRARARVATAPRGIYLCGRVGRGKTFLCDLFYAAAPPARKRRAHFHRFMQDIHTELTALEGRSDPLDEVAARIAADVGLLVLDEFSVDDIGDAMVLGNLLRALFAQGVVLVATSNTRLADLYKDGLQRERFLPAIALIEQHCDVVELVSPHDWRLRALKQAPVYLTPAGADAERRLLAIFNRVAHGELQRDFMLPLNGRLVPVRRQVDGAIWFDFTALCEGPRAVADYIALAKAGPAIIISNVPQFTVYSEDAAKRFVQLVDEFYDRHVKLVLSAAAPITELYDGERLRAEFGRTESRLIEMQSEEYLALPHLPE